MIHLPSLAAGATISAVVIFVVFLGFQGMSTESELKLEATPKIEAEGPSMVTNQTLFVILSANTKIPKPLPACSYLVHRPIRSGRRRLVPRLRAISSRPREKITIRTAKAEGSFSKYKALNWPLRAKLCVL